MGALAVHSTLPSWTLLPLVPPSPFQGSLHTWGPAGAGREDPAGGHVLLLGKDQLHGALQGWGTDSTAIGWPGAGLSASRA